MSRARGQPVDARRPSRRWRSLRGQLVLAFAAVAVFCVAVALVARALVRSGVEREAEHRLELIRALVQAEVEGVARGDLRSLQRMCATITDIERATAVLPGRRPLARRSRELTDVASEWSRALDLAWIAAHERNGTVIARSDGHVGAGDRDDELTARVSESRPVQYVRFERVRRTPPRPVLLSACVARGADSQIVLAGARPLDDAFASRFRVAGLVDVAVGDAAGHAAGPTAPGRAWAARAPRRTVPLTDARGRTVATLLVSVSDAPLRSALGKLDWLVGAMALFGAVLAWALGLVAARRIVSPLGELIRGAERIAAGDLGGQLEVRGGGEIALLVTAFNAMTAELRAARERLIRAERVAAWREIARRIAHEIKNPLSPIRTSIETLQKVHASGHPQFAEIFAEASTTILEEVERMRRIVEEFSRFARMPKPRAELMDLREVIEAVVSLYGGGTVVVTTRYDPQAGLVRADREQVTQVVHNLLQNACDAAGSAPAGGRVTVTLDPGDWGAAVVRIVDDGPGIPVEIRDRIFDPYFTTKSGGTGLGLAIVHRIVTDHGGRISFECPSSGGTRFTVMLPREGPPAEASTGDGAVSPAGSGKSAASWGY